MLRMTDKPVGFFANAQNDIVCSGVTGKGILIGRPICFRHSES